jgi:hypothetical protein
MSNHVFDTAIKQMADLDFDCIQTSGNGDALLHPNFMMFAEELREEFPDKQIRFYSSFASVYPKITDQIAEQGLFDQVFTRLDSLNPDIITRATGILGQTILENIAYFLQRSRPTTKLWVGYSSIPEYYRKCQKITGHLPMKPVFQPSEVGAMHDEFLEIGQWISEMGAKGPVQTYKINQSLWAERHHPETPIDLNAPCPKLPYLNDILWICPDGRLDLCGYDDSQDLMTYGNILEEHIIELWNSPKRESILQDIKNKRYDQYPVCNPICCRMYSDEEV